LLHPPNLLVAVFVHFDLIFSDVSSAKPALGVRPRNTYFAT
jgi:hypothetical protein